MHKKTKSTRTYNSKIAAIRYTYRKAIKRCVADCYLPLKRNTKKSERIIPSKEEMVKIITNCEDLELLCFIMLSAGSGLRRTEIATLKVKDIIKGRYTISVIGKGQRERKTVIDDATLLLLDLNLLIILLFSYYKNILNQLAYINNIIIAKQR